MPHATTRGRWHRSCNASGEAEGGGSRGGVVARPTVPASEESASSSTRREAARSAGAGYRWRGSTIGAVAGALVVGVLVAVWLLARPLALLLAAIVIAETLAPLIALLERRLPRAVAVGVVYVTLLAALGVVGWLVVPALVEQAQALAASLPALIEEGRRWVRRQDGVDDELLTRAVQERVGRLLGPVATLPLTVLSSVTEIVLVFTVSAYWLLATPALTRFALSLVATRHRPLLAETLGEMGQTMGGYLRGIALDALALAVLTYGGLLLIGVDYALMLALLAGLGAFVPIVGPLLTAVPALVIALLESPRQALLVRSSTSCSSRWRATSCCRTSCASSRTSRRCSRSWP